MRFFEITTTTDGKLLQKQYEHKHEFGWAVDRLAREICDKDRSYFDELEEEQIFFNFTTIDEQKTQIAALSKINDVSKAELAQKLTDYFALHNYKADLQTINEITFSRYRSALGVSERNDFIRDAIDILEKYLTGFSEETIGNFLDNNHPIKFKFQEYLLKDEAAEAKQKRLEDLRVRRGVLSFITLPELEEEAKRIADSKRETYLPGNPVHYVFALNDAETCAAGVKYLLKSLYKAKRINSKRYVCIDYKDLCKNYIKRRLENVYRLQEGGVVVLKIDEAPIADGEYLVGRKSRAGDFCKMAMKWKNKVLTIFCFTKISEKQREQFFAELDGLRLFTINESALFGDDAKEVLKSYAKEVEATANAKLLKKVEEGKGYTKGDLRRIFDAWYDEYLQKEVFPEYANEVLHQCKGKKTQGSGYMELNDLIGLSETKELINEILDVAKAKKMFPDSGFQNNQALHMVFAGNPGSAKTTVARLVAQILKENDILENGNLLEVGRGDLVGQYVGHTAVQVQGVFKKARGSVLFIDEAYSLVDDRNGSFGDEAINTIVQEMENKRDEVVVIFAGYPDKMEKFLNKNPGLRSRIGFHVNFPDYSADEMLQILEKFAGDDKLILAEGVSEKVMPLFEKAVNIAEFGNGRYVRNLIEKARMKQARRLVKMERADVTEEMGRTLLPEDFSEIRLGAELKEKERMGFVA